MSADPEFKPKSDFLRVMRDRGYIHQVTDAEALADLLQSTGR